MKEKYHNIYTAIGDDCLFPKQFANWEDFVWDNKKYPAFYKRLNNIEDDRSFVILAMNVLEGQIDKFLDQFIPEPQILFNDRTNLVSKIKIIQAFKLLPPQFFEMFDVLRNIRNFFAHNLEIDGFDENLGQQKLSVHIETMHKIWKEYELDMGYWKQNRPTRLMFKDLWNVCFRGLHVFERNIKFFRQETENPKFIESLYQKSLKLEQKLGEERVGFIDDLIKKI